MALLFFLIQTASAQSGCTNPDASNYDPNVVSDDGSCTYGTETGSTGATCSGNSDCWSYCCSGGYCADDSACESGSFTTSSGSSGTTTGSSTTSSSSSGVYIPGSETGLPAPEGGIPQILSNFLTWLLGIIGIIALISFVISGMQYILSSGNQDMMETAKRNMIYSIIGVVVVLASFVIIQAIHYALNAQTGF